MRPDRKDLISAEADELAAEAFDRYPPDVEQWVRDALVGEWGDTAEKAAHEVMAAAVALGAYPIPSEPLYRIRRAVGALRDMYVDHASVRGLYAAEAEDRINCAASDEAEARRERDIDNVTLKG